MSSLLDLQSVIEEDNLRKKFGHLFEEHIKILRERGKLEVGFTYKDLIFMEFTNTPSNAACILPIIESRYMENTDNGHNKFYAVYLLGDMSKTDFKVFSEWGKIGTRGQSQLQHFDNIKNALNFINDKITSKTSPLSGYRMRAVDLQNGTVTMREKIMTGRQFIDNDFNTTDKAVQIGVVK